MKIGSSTVLTLRVGAQMVQKAYLGSQLVWSAESPFSPASLFAAGEQGLWYDVSDFSTLFQDAAGTIPVTAVEQPVGLILDKSGRGNHASQATTTARGVLRARYNLLTYSENFSNPAWFKQSGVTITGKKIVELSGTSVSHRVYRVDIAATTGAAYKAFARLKADGRNFVSLRLEHGTQNHGVLVDLATGLSYTGLYDGVNQALPLSNLSVTLASDGYWEISGEFVASATPIKPFIYLANSTTTTTYTGDGASGVLCDGIDLRPTNLPASLPPYQRIAAATDYDTVGFPVYLDIDGTDDSYQTGSIDFSGTDKVTIWAGLRKVDDTMRMLLEHGALVEHNRFYSAVGTNYAAASSGTIPISTSHEARIPSQSAAESVVISQTHNIAGDLSTVRRNGSSSGATNATVDQGTGNFGNKPLYLFARNNGTLRWKGPFYSLVIRGAATDAETIEKMEQVINTAMKEVY